MDAMKMLGPRLRARRAAVPEDLCSPPSSSPALPISAEQVYRDYAPRVYNVARRMVSNDFDAEDVTQDVLLQVVRKLPSFRGEAAFPTWLHRVTINTVLSHRRRQAVRQQHGLSNSLDAFGEDEPLSRPTPGRIRGPEDQMLVRETRQLIERAIESLPPRYQTVFVLADVEGWSNAEVAAHLGLSLAAIKSRLHRARLLLRDALARHFEEIAT
jgi:RNA polymerase sigma-70 factor (ECF subfamily)